MPAHRKSSNVLRLGGAFKANPKRLAGRELEPQDNEALGGPPSTFTPNEAECWRHIVLTAPTGLLRRRDTLIVEQAAGLLAVIRSRGIGNCATALLTEYRQVLAKLGLSPSDGPRVQVAPASEHNEFDDVTKPRRR